MLGDNQTVKMAAIQSALDENMQFSDYFVGLDGPANLKNSDYKENVELIIM